MVEGEAVALAASLLFTPLSAAEERLQGLSDESREMVIAALLKLYHLTA